MKNVFKKIVKILKKVLLALLGLLLIFLLSTTIWNKVVCIQEDKALRNVGTNVKVNSTNIRVSVTGKGKKTILLLSEWEKPVPLLTLSRLLIN
jgi:hypothetical protein